MAFSVMADEDKPIVIQVALILNEISNLTLLISFNEICEAG